LLLQGRREKETFLAKLLFSSIWRSGEGAFRCCRALCGHLAAPASLPVSSGLANSVRWQQWAGGCAGSQQNPSWEEGSGGTGLLGAGRVPPGWLQPPPDSHPASPLPGSRGGEWKHTCWIIKWPIAERNQGIFWLIIFKPDPRKKKYPPKLV